MPGGAYDPHEWEELHWEYEPVALGSPAAGSALTYTVPTSVEQLVVAVSFTYTADGNAANRVPFVQFLDQSGVSLADVGTPFLLVATNASRITFAIGVDQYGSNSAARIGCGLPAITLADGMQLKINATGIQAGDTITTARLYVRQRTTLVPDPPAGAAGSAMARGGRGQLPPSLEAFNAAEHMAKVTGQSMMGY